jgi:hypothetical protein
MSEFETQANKASNVWYNALVDNYFQPVPEWVISEKDMIIDSLRNAWINGSNWRVGQLMSKHQEEIERLKAELKAERLTVDWYADSAKWQFEKLEEVGFYKEGEGVFFVDEYGLRLCDGGSRARQRQKERKDDV